MLCSMSGPYVWHVSVHQCIHNLTEPWVISKLLVYVSKLICVLSGGKLHYVINDPFVGLPIQSDRPLCPIQALARSSHFQPLMANHIHHQFVTPGQCHMSTMFQQVINSSHWAWVKLCFLLSRMSHSTWQSILISIGDLYIMASNSSSTNFSAANSSRNGS